MTRKLIKPISKEPSIPLVNKKAIFSKEDKIDFYTDPEEELYKKGIYYITDLIEANDLLEIQQDIMLKNMNPDWTNDIQLIINSPGGSVSEGMALVDLLDWIRMDVRTVAMGYCASMGAVIACCGTTGKRMIAPNCSIMIHGASWQGQGGVHQMIATAKEMEREHERDVKFWLKHSKYTKREDIEKHFLNGRNDEFMNAEEALVHGIFDGIVGQPIVKKPKRKLRKR